MAVGTLESAGDMLGLHMAKCVGPFLVAIGTVQAMPNPRAKLILSRTHFREHHHIHLWVIASKKLFSAKFKLL